MDDEKTKFWSTAYGLAVVSKEEYDREVKWTRGAIEHAENQVGYAHERLDNHRKEISDIYPLLDEHLDMIAKLNRRITECWYMSLAIWLLTVLAMVAYLVASGRAS